MDVESQDEMAARLVAECPAYLVAMGANDELLEADLIEADAKLKIRAGSNFEVHR